MLDKFETVLLIGATSFAGVLIYIAAHHVLNYTGVVEEEGMAVVTAKDYDEESLTVTPVLIGKTVIARPEQHPEEFHLTATVGGVREVEFEVDAETYKQTSVGTEIAVTFRRGRLNGAIDVTGYTMASQ